jgi:hypothetical protein
MAARKKIRTSTKHGLTAIALVATAAIAIASGALATPPAAAPSDESPAPPPSDAAAVAVQQVDPTKAQIVIGTVPPSNATVTWGRTKLGRIKPRQPLVVVRPRDSGPLDVMIRAPGYLPVQTRAHTFADSKLMVKLTRIEDKATLLGYRAPLDAGLPLGADGGVPETLTGMPPSLTAPGTAPLPGAPPAATPPTAVPPTAVPPAQSQPGPVPPAQPAPPPAAPPPAAPPAAAP